MCLWCLFAEVDLDFSGILKSELTHRLRYRTRLEAIWEIAEQIASAAGNGDRPALAPCRQRLKRRSCSGNHG
jgi:hypothetical protein